MKPIIILPPNAMTEECIKLLRENDLCVVIAEDPALVKFVDPIPAVSSRTQIEHAAIQLSRKLLNKNENPWDETTRGSFSRMFMDILLKGSPLDAGPTKEEQERQFFIQEKFEELRRLAREEAKAERAAAKAKVASK